MAFHATAPIRGASLARPVELACFALICSHALYLTASYVQGTWLIEPNGAANASDFVNVWAAGRLVLEGTPAAAYDWPVHKAMEEIAVGHAFDGYFGWHYPPTFLFVAAALSIMPYLVAYVAWVFGTFPLYLAAMRGITGERTGYFLAAAFPAVLANFIVGQNGFLTAALVGSALLFMERRPVLAGLLLGLLTYKPHLGLLFPFVLAASGHWRVFFVAAATAVAMAIAAWLAFGTEAWFAFRDSLGHTSQAFLSSGWADWSKLQTAFGLTRTLGGGEQLAWTIQVSIATAVAAAVSILWRRDIAYEVKAAALATGSMLATPYLYTYDLVVLAVPLAFLFKLGRERGFLPNELAGIGLACLLVLIFPFVKAPVGFAAILVVAALVARRVRMQPQFARA